MKILISEIELLPQDFQEKLKAYDFDIYENQDLDFSQYDVVFGGIVVKKVGLEKFNHVKWIQVSTAGYNHLPIQMWADKGIIVTNAKHVFSDPIAEHVLFYTLMHYKNGLEHLDLQRNKIFKRCDNRELEDEVICVLGTGSLGQGIAKRFKAFNSHVIGINSNGRYIEHFDECYEMIDLKKILERSDVVVITLPLTNKTKYFYDESFFEVMKTGSILLNVGRGRIIDETALIKHLNSNHLAYAMLDVMETEPIPQDSLLWTTDHLLLTAHDSGSSSKTHHRLLKLFIDNIGCYLGNKALHNRL